MSATAAKLVADSVKAAPRLSLCLAAGSTPAGMYRELVRLNKAEGLDFSAATFFFLDDYVGLPADHPESFKSFLWREFFGPIHISAARVHVPDANYEKTIRAAVGIDLLICGIGPNGHVAFNEPGTPVDSRTRIVELADSTLDELRGRFTPEEMPRQAITMGLATILESNQIFLLVSGAKKAAILSRALFGPITTDVPATILRMHPNVTVITDQK